jgi:branched-chain amino acid transport system ATP-binding protein
MSAPVINQAGAGTAPSAERSAIALRVDNVSKRFGGVLAVSNVSFNVMRGKATALIGPNGAGKTTVFNLITNLMPPTAGSVHVNGMPVAGLSSSRIASLGLIRTFQSARVFPGMTTLENVMVGAHRHLPSDVLKQALWLPSARKAQRELEAKARALLDIADLAPYADTAATDLPMGGQKKLEVMRALMAQPKLLLLDEPAAGLNDTETEELATLLLAVRELGITIVVVDHNMSLVMKVADEIVVLDAGVGIATGAPAEIQCNARVIEAYMGLEASA